MANRHKAQSRAQQGRGKGSNVFYAGGNSNVAKEAMERKDGGPVELKHGGKAAKKRLDKRARGGRMDGGSVGAGGDGSQGGPRPSNADSLANALGQRRARGGKVGSDKNPFSSAHVRTSGDA